MKPWRAVGRYGSVGIEFVATVGVGYFAGRWLDRRFEAHGWLIGLGLLVGTYAAFRLLFKLSSQMTRDIEREEREERGPRPWRGDGTAPSSRVESEVDEDDDDNDESDGERKN